MNAEFKTALLAMACFGVVMAGVPVHAEELHAAQDREATTDTSSGNSLDEQQEGESRPIKNDLEQSNWLVVTWENDLFAFNDDGYTNGISVGWGTVLMIPSRHWRFRSGFGLSVAGPT